MILTLSLALALASPPVVPPVPPVPASSRPAISPDAPAYARCLVERYPEHLCGADAQALLWCDGTRMPWRSREAGPLDEAALDRADLHDQLATPYPAGPWRGPPVGDPGRARAQPFFEKLYGAHAKAVASTLVPVAWPGGQRLSITRINGVDAALRAVAAELERLPADLQRFVSPSAGTFVWRRIKGTERLSMHSFGVAIDIGVAYSDYWRWVRPGRGGERPYRNRFPPEIVAIFEAHGFIWGGKWAHFDTMHFEHRPELLHPACQAR